MIKNRGFSLSEILMTLIIIGIVSAVALPTLRKTVGNKQYDAMMGKNYLNFKLAWETIISDNKGYMTDTFANSDAFVTELTNHKIYGHKCTASNNCFTYKLKGVAPTGFTAIPDTAVKIILDDGSIVAVDYISACNGKVGNFTGNVCGQIWLDVNGTEKPNMYSKDIYGFILTKDSLEPADINYVMNKK